MSLQRILAVFLRQVYLYKRSLPRIIEILYWPLMDLLLWGFISLYLTRYQAGLPNFVAILLGALILWDILFRAQLGISVSFLEDVWARSFLNLFVSPLRPSEYLISLMMVSAMKIVLAGAVMSCLAWIFYSFNIFLIGISLVPFVICLVALGWAIGIFTTSLILRFGQQAEVMAWGVTLLFQPVSAVFYPVSILPPFLQAVARYVPSSYVFEGMREVISNGGLPLEKLVWAAGLDAVYLSAVILFFHRVLKTVREKGLLARIGE